MNKKADYDWGAISLIVILIVSVILLPYYQKIRNLEIYLSNLNLSFYLLLLFGAIAILVISYILVIAVKNVCCKLISWRDKTRREKIEANETEELFDKDLPIDEQTLKNETEMLRNKIKSLKQSKNSYFIPKLRKRLAKAMELLVETRESRFLDQQLYQKRTKIDSLDEEIRIKEINKQNRNKVILWELKSKENPVFIKDKLNKEQINALLENGYQSVSEYCIIEKKLINVLVKPQLNHSITHTFLVWNVVKLLKTINGIKEIREHLSVDADITFLFNGQIYALEIETGTLLGKSKQTQEKISYLNRKYKNKWMFIVSNRDLLKRYNKLGFSTQRAEVSKNLAKMLKIAHPV